jgi:cell division septum initiation protein DivIVA
MPVTLGEVGHVTFKDEVDRFVGRVHAELARLIEENNELRHQLEQLDAQRHAVPVETGCEVGSPPPDGLVRTPSSPTGEQSSPGADHTLQTATMLVLAREGAGQVNEEANAEVDRMLNQARATCARLLSEAQVKAEDMVNEARTRVESMLQDARSTAETLQRQSRQKAASLEQDATRKHAEILRLNHDKSLLESTIDGLRAFEQEYRTQLVIYFQLLLDKLDGPGSAASAESSLIHIPCYNLRNAYSDGL